MSKRRFEYALLPAEWIDYDTRWRAWIAVQTACKYLRMAEPEIVWYLPSEAVMYTVRRVTPNVTNADGEPADVTGWASPDEPDRIYLRADRPATFMQTALHECRHLWQYTRPADFRSHQVKEADAEAWAAEAMRYPLDPIEVPR